jgi:hypothetical protein
MQRMYVTMRATLHIDRMTLNLKCSRGQLVLRGASRGSTHAVLLPMMMRASRHVVVSVTKTAFLGTPSRSDTCAVLLLAHKSHRRRSYLAELAVERHTLVYRSTLAYRLSQNAIAARCYL